jgi:Restriction endonuclease XhoI/Eco57I restriction-modification methylase
LISGQLAFNFLHEGKGINSIAVDDALENLASQDSLETRGAIFTRLEVVEFILDLAGYTENQPLYEKRLLEPSFGGGQFLLPIIKRLLVAWRRLHSQVSALDILGDAIRAVELHRKTFQSTRAAVVELLIDEGLSITTAAALADRWLFQGDFLLASLDGQFDFVVGNPPYVRQEMIPALLLAEYRSRYQTLYDRADLYIPFIERSLSLLTKGGCLGFICADRWMKNRYGGPLRNLIAEQFYLKIYVDMVDTPAFQSDVMAYPAITIISRESPGGTRIAHRPMIDSSALATLAEMLRIQPFQQHAMVRELPLVPNGSDPWLLVSADQKSLIRRLEQAFPRIEEAGCKVGIGVATGADKAFIGNFDALDVESDRKLPLVTTKDIRSGEVLWLGQGVINPFAEGGGLVDLQDYPRLRRYLEDRREVIEKRHCAQRFPNNWYRTIDRINPILAKQLPVKDRSPHFSIFKEFRGASYLDRYDLLCQRLVQEQLYTTAALITSPRNAAESGQFAELSPMTGLRTVVTTLAGHVAAGAARLG